MTLWPKFRLGITGGQDGGAATHFAEGGGGLETQLPSRGDNQVGNLVALEMRPHVFHRIEFRGIRWQCFEEDPSSGRSHIVPHQGTAMNGRSIPEDEQSSRDVPLEVPQEFDDLRAFDAALVNLEVESPQGQPADDRETLPIEALLQIGRLPSGRPSPRARRLGAQPTLVDEDDGASLPVGFFLISGHRDRFQRPMAFGSRSMARRSGRWQLNPSAPSTRQT